MDKAKKVISAALCASMLCGASAAPSLADGVSLLENGGFEDALLGKDSWHFSGKGGWYNESDTLAQAVGTEKHSGASSLKLNKATAGQRVTLNAGQSYRLTAYVKADSATSNLFFGFFDGSQEYPASYPLSQSQINATTEWQRFTVDYDCSVTKDYVICLGEWNDDIAVYFDDVTLEAYETDIPDSGIVNPSFSDGASGWQISDADCVNVSDGFMTISGNDYTTRISQTVSNLENGVYDLTASVSASDITGEYYLYAKAEGHTVSRTAAVKGSQKITAAGIMVDNGTLDIGFFASGSASVTLDNFALTRSDQTRLPFLKGGEISKLTYVEDMGGKFRYADGTEGDALQIMAENGFNLARIRLLDNPGKGRGEFDASGNPTYYLPEYYMTEADCLSLARRAKDKGMQILFSFAYSDYWVDGEKQYIPSRWQEEITAKNLTGALLYDYLEEKTYSYTKDVMQKLKAQGTCPEYVSIGNEMQVGLYFGKYGTPTLVSALYNKADMLARFLNAGARAVREVSPETKIVLHSDNGGKLSKRSTFLSALSKVGDNFDVIGVSYYPYYNADVSIDTVVSEFNQLITTYDKDVMIMETGYNWDEHKPDGWDGQLRDSGYYQNIYGESQEGQRAFLTELYAKLKQVSGGRCVGDLYWDPVMIYTVDENGNQKVGWAIKESDDTTDINVVPNSTIFDFEGKAVEGQLAMRYNTNATDNIIITGTITTADGPAANKSFNFTVNGERCTSATDKFGKYILSVPYPKDERFSITAEGCHGGVYEDIEAPYDSALLGGVDFTADDDGKEDPIAFFNANSNSFSVRISSKNENETLYVALYDNGGRLLSCVKDIQNGEFRVRLESGREYVAKAFLWNGMTPVDKNTVRFTCE